MKQYIDKDDLVAEIERRKRTISTNSFLSEYEAGCNDGRENAYDDILSFLNTLEVKEVDLEEEMRNYIINHYRIGSDTLEFDLNEVIKHFFELGLKAQKGE